jgi:hypothetical protein
MPNDGNPVRISIPYRDDGTVDPALDAAVDAAISRWTTALSPTLSIPLTKVYNVTCGVFDNHCAQILIQNPPNRPDACAETQSYPGSDGVWNQSARTYVRQSYTGWSSDFLNETLTHELGHYLDLLDQSTNCTVEPDATPASIMNTPVACNNMSGLVSTPQPSDVLPIIKSAYGSTPKKICQ